MFGYCTQVLHLSEFEAYLRITAARAARQHPVLLAMLREGSLHLTAVAKLAPHLTPDNSETLVRRAAHRTKREVEELIAELAPRPDARMVVRKLPNRGPGTTPVPALRNGSDRAASPDTRLGLDRVEFSGLNLTCETSAAGLPSEVSGTAPAEPVQPSGTAFNRVATDATRDPSPLDGAAQPIPGLASPNRSLVAGRPRPHPLEPLSPGRYKIQFTASAAFRDKLERLAALMRSSGPDGDLAVIIEQAVTEKLERLEARRFAKTHAPTKGLSDSDTSSRPRATSRPRSGGPSTSETRAGAATSTTRTDDAPRPTGSSSTTGAHSATAESTRWRTSRSCAEPTTTRWPRSTTAGRPWRGTAAEGLAGRFRLRPSRRYPSTHPPDSGSRHRRESRAAPGGRPGPSDAPSAPWPRPTPGRLSTRTVRPPASLISTVWARRTRRRGRPGVGGSQRTGRAAFSSRISSADSTKSSTKRSRSSGVSRSIARICSRSTPFSSMSGAAGVSSRGAAPMTLRLHPSFLGAFPGTDRKGDSNGTEPTDRLRFPRRPPRPGASGD